MYGPVYVNALVMVNQYPHGGGTTQTLYVQQDANWNVTALVNGTPGSSTYGQVVQRFTYTPFGVQTVLTGTWASSTSAADIAYGFQGGRYDSATGLYNFQHRDYSPTLQRWIEQDPLGFGAGDSNLYRMEGDNPGDRTDPGGLDFWAWIGQRLINNGIVGDNAGDWRTKAVFGANDFTNSLVNRETGGGQKLLLNALGIDTVDWKSPASEHGRTFNPVTEIVNRWNASYNTFRESRENKFASGFLATLVVIADFVGITNLYEAVGGVGLVTGSDTLTTRQLGITERWIKGILGSVQLGVSIWGGLELGLGGLKAVAPTTEISTSGASPTAFEEFMAGRTFGSAEEAQRAWAYYQQAARAESGLVIGHGNAPIMESFNGWQALRMGQNTYTEAINQAWIEGAVDSGLPVRLVTSLEQVIRDSTTWQEIQWVINRGGMLIGG